MDAEGVGILAIAWPFRVDPNLTISFGRDPSGFRQSPSAYLVALPFEVSLPFESFGLRFRRRQRRPVVLPVRERLYLRFAGVGSEDFPSCGVELLFERAFRCDDG